MSDTLGQLSMDQTCQNSKDRKKWPIAAQIEWERLYWLEYIGIINKGTADSFAKKVQSYANAYRPSDEPS